MLFIKHELGWKSQGGWNDRNIQHAHVKWKTQTKF